ncbi:MAG: hypothetical protein ABII00_12030 [Elusimicrobiota bacterium]
MLYRRDGWGSAKIGVKDPDSKLHGKYEELKSLGIVREICDYCAGAFKVKDGLKGEPLVGDFAGHPSLKRRVDKGYRIIVL